MVVFVPDRQHKDHNCRIACRFKLLFSVISLLPARVQVDVQDTVGCGDSFAAAIVLGYTRGHRIPPLLALANAVGAATAMGSGAGAKFMLR